MSRKILISVDDTSSADRLRDILNQDGYHAVPVSPGEIHDTLGREPVDCVLMGVDTAGKKDGVEIFSEIRKQHRVPLIYLIDGYDPVIISRARETEPAGYIRIPPDPGDVKATVETALSRGELQKKLEESEDKYLELMNSARDVIVILNEDTTIQFINRSAENIFGYTAEEVQGTPFLQYLHPDEVERVITRFRMRVDGKEVPNQYESVLIHKDGSRIDVEVTGVRITYMDRPSVLVILRDIRERKKAESALKRSEEQYRMLINSLDEAIHVVDRDLTLTLINKRFLEWNRSLGLPTDITGKPLFEVFHFLDDSIRDEYLKVLETGKKLVTRESTVVDDHTIYTETQKIPIIMNNRVGQIVTAISDITDYVQKERKITDSLREKEILLKEIHHRVKNNMQVVSSLLNLQSRHIQNGEDLRLFRESQNRVFSIALVHEKLYQSENLAEIDFLDYLKSLVTELSNIYLRTKMVDTDLYIENVFLTIDKAIPCALIVNELVSNAMKHAFDEDQAGNITISIRESDGCYNLDIGDNGSGLNREIDVEKADSLGLQLVNALIRQLNGKLSVDRNGGTRFTIVFPVAAELHGG